MSRSIKTKKTSKRPQFRLHGRRQTTTFTRTGKHISWCSCAKPKMGDLRFFARERHEISSYGF